MSSKPHQTTPPLSFPTTPIRALLLLGAVALLGGCSDDPFQREWEANPDTAAIFSLARPELELPSAFSFRNRRTLQVQDPAATGEWDVALDTRDGDLVFVLPGAFGVESQARIAPLPGLDFDDLREAPTDSTVFVADRAPVELGMVYVVRTTERPGVRCVFFVKFQTTAIDIGEQSVEFRFDGSPFCNDRDLVPPDS